MGWPITKFFNTDDEEVIRNMKKENVIGQLCDMVNFKYTGVPLEDMWNYQPIADYFGITSDDFVKDYEVLTDEEKSELGVDYLYRPVGYQWDRASSHKE